MSLYSELEDIAKSVRIKSAMAYTFQGSKYVSKYDSEQTTPSDDVSSTSNHLLLHLTDMFYRIFHCKQTSNFENRENRIATSIHYLHIQDYVNALSNANSGRGTWDLGWEIKEVQSSRKLKVYKDGLTLLVSPQQFVTYSSYDDGKKGDVMMVKEFRELMPGFYTALGNEPLKSNEKNIPIIRFYWNIAAQYAVPLMKILTTGLNSLNVPFHFKILNNPYNFPRTDAAVLYLNKNYLKRSTDTLLGIYQQVKTFLNPSTSLFAKRIAPGLALAEEPNNNDNNESFGQQCCRILAEALYSAYQKNLKSIDEKVAEIVTYWRSLGLTVEQPYLNPGSVDDYDLVVKEASDD